MCPEKLTQVTDYLHGSIPLTRLEKSVLSTEAFNRLHNVLQNSSAYLTYPSNNHSRFAHSLGVLHFAGEIFWSGFVGANDDDRRQLIEDTQRVIKDLAHNESFGKDVRHLLHDYTVGSKLQSLDYGAIAEPVLRRRLAGGLRDKSEIASFLLLFQAVRMAGLLHDLGHPPFSHIVESALTDLYREIKKKQDDLCDLTEREQKFVDILAHYEPDLAPIHEEIGKHLATHVLEAAVQSLASKEKDEIFLNLIVTHLTLKILREKTGFCGAIHSIVDSSLDADRLDYVARDALMTGFTDGGFRYTRLLNSFRLRYRRDVPLFLPSVQALSTIEDFFERRLNLYVYVVYHHRVVKTDGLLREVVIGLAREHLENEIKDPRLEDFALPTDISGLWRVLDPEWNVSGVEIVNHYMQWDDAWLLTVLRRYYFSRKPSDHGQTTAPRLLDVQLEEFLSNKKHYYSLFKRPDSFAPIDESFLDCLKDFKLDVLRQAKDSIVGTSQRGRVNSEDNSEDKWAAAYRLVEDYYNAWPWREPSDGDAQRVQRARIREKQGFFLVNLFRLLSLLEITRMSLIRRAAECLKKECGLHDVFSVEKRLKTGVDEDFALLRGEEIRSLREFSEITEQLERRSRFFPGFFIYLYLPAGFRDDEIAEIGLKFASLLADEFKGAIDEVLK